MSKLDPKIALDEAIVQKIIKFYKFINVPDGILTDVKVPCFSNPQVNVHMCNAMAHLPNDEICTSCKHDSSRICAYTCHISYFCMAAFASRLQLGALDAMLKLPYAELVRRIQGSLSGESVVEVPAESENESLKFNVSENDRLTVREAAEYCGCTTANIYMKLNSGKLPYIIQDGTRYINRNLLTKKRGS
jgi:excisionase family DNA binding protein